MPDLRWASGAGRPGCSSCSGRWQQAQQAHGGSPVSAAPVAALSQQKWPVAAVPSQQQLSQQHLQPVRRPVVPITGCCSRLPKGPCAAVLPIASMPPASRPACRSALVFEPKIQAYVPCGKVRPRLPTACTGMLLLAAAAAACVLSFAAQLGVQSHTCANRCCLPYGLLAATGVDQEEGVHAPAAAGRPGGAVSGSGRPPASCFCGCPSPVNWHQWSLSHRRPLRCCPPLPSLLHCSAADLAPHHYQPEPCNDRLDGSRVPWRRTDFSHPMAPMDGGVEARLQ